MTNKYSIVIFCVISLFFNIRSLEAQLNLNNLQALSTYHSYHLPPTNLLPAWNFSQPSLSDQLTCYGVRGFRFDVSLHNDIFEVHHVDGYDPNSLCNPIDDCLYQLRMWSMTNPTHVPLLIHIDITHPAQPSSDDFSKLESLIGSLDIWGNSIITPDSIKGSYSTVQQAANAGAWPSIDSVRGQAIFLLTAQDISNYISDQYSSLSSRNAFVSCNFDNRDSDINCGIITFLDSFYYLSDDNDNRAAMVDTAISEGYLVEFRSDINYAAYPPSSNSALNNLFFIVLDIDTSNTVSSSEVKQYLTTDYFMSISDDDDDLITSNVAYCSDETDALTFEQFMNCYLPLYSDFTTLKLGSPAIPIYDTNAATKRRRDSALASGATWISTDFLYPNMGDDFYVKFPENVPVRCNPITTVSCDPGVIENGLTDFTCAAYTANASPSMAPTATPIPWNPGGPPAWLNFVFLFGLLAAFFGFAFIVYTKFIASGNPEFI